MTSKWHCTSNTLYSVCMCYSKCDPPLCYHSASLSMSFCISCLSPCSLINVSIKKISVIRKCQCFLVTPSSNPLTYAKNKIVSKLRSLRPLLPFCPLSASHCSSQLITLFHIPWDYYSNIIFICVKWSNAFWKYKQIRFNFNSVTLAHAIIIIIKLYYRLAVRHMRRQI